MTGTEKQIRWAEEIREKKMAVLEVFIRKAAEAEGAGPDEAQAMLEQVREVLLGQTEAGWWIDNRAMSIHSLIYMADRDAAQGRGREKALGQRPLDWEWQPTTADTWYRDIEQMERGL